MAKIVFDIYIFISKLWRLSKMTNIEKNQENIQNGVSNMIHAEQ
ncbi:hypothetical protein [Borreliella bavariensis]|nr:hypothetical protein [Borreliella bavariensis]